jgi:flagellar biosynthetic protein FlhB
MADEFDQERTLPPTPRRLEQAREEGQVARSRELAACATVAASAAVAWWAGPTAVAACMRIVERGLVLRQPDLVGDGVVTERFASLLFDGVLVLVPLFAVVAAAAIAASVLVGGWTFAPKAFAPDLQRMSPLRGLGQIFSGHGAAELVKAIAKALFIALAAGGFLWTSRDALMALGTLELRDGIAALGTLVQHALLWLAGALALIAAVDVPLVLYRHYARLRMTPEEYKREQREAEGDPQLKARIRSLQRERARKRMMAEVPKADVVVTNPTHYAVALSYREGTMSAPRVVAKGQELVAAKIRALASDNAVPLLEAPPLARALYFSTEIGDDIPAPLYNAVAQVLAWVYQVRRWRQGHGAEPAAPRDLDVPVELDRGGEHA